MLLGRPIQVTIGDRYLMLLGKPIQERYRTRYFTTIGDRYLMLLGRPIQERYRTRYFTDSGIIGSKEFVTKHYQQFKHLFQSKNEKIPKPIQGLSGIYSMKRLSELI